MRIRLEEINDRPAIFQFVEEAFKTAKVKDGDEQNFVDRVRASEGYLPELAFVAEEGTEIIGFVMLFKTMIHSDNQSKELLILAPLAVAINYRKKGIGGQLIERAVEEAKQLGYAAILLVGEPNYYQRYGFVEAASFGISSEPAIPSEYVLIRSLKVEETQDLAGIVTIPL